MFRQSEILNLKFTKLNNNWSFFIDIGCFKWIIVGTLTIYDFTFTMIKIKVLNLRSNYWSKVGNKGKPPFNRQIRAV